MSLQALRYVTTFLMELLGLATAQGPLFILFKSVDDLTGSQALPFCYELTGSQVCDNLPVEFLRLVTAQHPLLMFFDLIHELKGSRV